LQEQFLAFVEGALARTSPGRQFTLNVLAALPALSVSTKAAALGAAAAKGSVAAKSAGVLGLLGALLTPVMVVVGNYSNYRISMNEAHTEKERHHIKKFFRTSLIVTAIASAILSVPLYWATRDVQDRSVFWVLLFSQSIVVYFLTAVFLSFNALPRRRQYLARILAERYNGEFPEPAFEYRSRWSLLGLPLLHVRIGDRFDIMRGPVKAWIAIGSSHAVGVLFASGGLAVAPISFGGIAIGLLPFGALAMGVFSLGAFAIGVWAYGGAAIGWQICCGCGVAWNAAMGGVVVAHQFAMGGIAHAAQVNTETARQFFQQAHFIRIAQMLSNHHFFVMLLWVIPMLLQQRTIARARRRRELGLQN
jgi:hypothetical protein